eukprot:196661_1
MTCLSCIILPIAFAISFTCMFLVTYYLAVYKYKFFDYKTPIVCDMGAKKPGPYYSFLIGLTISALILLPLVIIQYFKRIECNSNNDAPFMAYNLISFISGILLCVGLIGMGIFDLDKYKAVHMGFTSLLLGSSNIHMVFSTVCTSMATSKRINCLNDNMKGIIIVRWVLLSIIIVLNCAVSGTWMYAIELSKKQTENNTVDKDKQNNIEDTEDKSLTQKIKCLMTFSAIGEYIYFCGFIIFVLLLIPTNLL